MPPSSVCVSPAIETRYTRGNELTETGGFMQLRRLQSFVRIVERRSFTEAAAALGLTTSALSKQIKALEEEVGAPLFHRSGAVEPTTVGRLVYERGKALLNDWDALVSDCRSLAGSPGGKLRIGASTVPASYLLPPIMKRLVELHPHVELSVVEDGSESVLQHLEARQIDVAFVGSRPPSPALRYVTVASDSLAIVAAEPVAARRGALASASLRDWVGLPFILREPGSGTRQALEQALERHGISASDLKVAAVSSSTESAMALAEAGIGVTAVSRWALALPRSVTVVAELPTDRRFYAAFETGRERDPLVQMFLDAAAAIYT